MKYLSLAVIVLGLVFVLASGVIFMALLTRVQLQTFPVRPDRPHVQVFCDSGLYLADNQCVWECPVGYQPFSWDERAICMTPAGEPVSIYDLAGFRVSADDGRTVYLIVENVTLEKILVASESDFNTRVWLSVSSGVLDEIASGPSYSWTLQGNRTEVATVGDTVYTFKVLKINPDSVDGVYESRYPLCCRYENLTIRIGNDIGIACEGISEKLLFIDFSNQIVVFVRVQQQPPYGECPICLSGNTLIDTPNGQMNVKELYAGASVWTINRYGQKESVPILEVSKTEVWSGHEMVHVILEDGRQLYVSPGHPTTEGRTFGTLKEGDLLDRSLVVVAELVPYDQPYTYDILPSGDTGFYWANGILIASTLR